MTIPLSPFTTSRNPDDTYSLTLAQLTSVFLNEIETLLGPRDPNYTYVGIEFDSTPNASPRIWFPHVGHPDRDESKPANHIIIRLTETAQSNANLAIWQLAHECVHLIDPWNIQAEGRPSNYLEEGIATWYQNTIIQNIPNNLPQYVEAKSLVEPHMPQLASTIKHLRTDQNLRISAIDDPDHLLKHYPDMNPKDAENLCSRFPIT